MSKTDILLIDKAPLKYLRTLDTRFSSILWINMLNL